MNWIKYTQLASNTRADLESPLMNQLHMVSGMVTEASEIMDAYKKHFAYGKELDVVNVEEEIGDLLWYIANFTDMMEFDLSDIMEKNIAKLQARFPNKFEADRAINRDLNNERQILEN